MKQYMRSLCVYRFAFFHIIIVTYYVLHIRYILIRHLNIGVHTQTSFSSLCSAYVASCATQTRKNGAREEEEENKTIDRPPKPKNLYIETMEQICCQLKTARL